MKSFRTALLFPPVWYYPNTPAEVAYLAAYLRTKGIEPYVRDFSIEMFDLILEEDWFWKRTGLRIFTTVYYKSGNLWMQKMAFRSRNRPDTMPWPRLLLRVSIL
ncbi:MAG: hypothetical protein QY317_01695 [Candidatus Jettenia caeni]|nr:MAG: hypothetical protein QY317_01695 [Candidatus Jettenia caeni]